MKIFENVNSSIKVLNSNKFFAGIIMLIMNLGSKFITIKFSPSQETYLKNTLGRQLLIFAICFIATKDIIISIILTSAFVMLADHLFNETSKFCVLPQSFKDLQSELDLNNDGKISEDEISKAIKLLSTHKKDKLEKAQKKAFAKFKKG